MKWIRPLENATLPLSLPSKIDEIFQISTSYLYNDMDASGKFADAPMPCKLKTLKPRDVDFTMSEEVKQGIIENADFFATYQDILGVMTNLPQQQKDFDFQFHYQLMYNQYAFKLIQENLETVTDVLSHQYNRNGTVLPASLVCDVFYKRASTTDLVEEPETRFFHRGNAPLNYYFRVNYHDLEDSERDRLFPAPLSQYFDEHIWDTRIFPYDNKLNIHFWVVGNATHHPFYVWNVPNDITSARYHYNYLYERGIIDETFLKLVAGSESESATHNALGHDLLAYVFWDQVYCKPDDAGNVHEPIYGYYSDYGHGTKGMVFDPRIPHAGITSREKEEGARISVALRSFQNSDAADFTNKNSNFNTKYSDCFAILLRYNSTAEMNMALTGQEEFIPHRKMTQGAVNFFLDGDDAANVGKITLARMARHHETLAAKGGVLPAAQNEKFFKCVESYMHETGVPLYHNFHDSLAILGLI
eukprot:gene28004-33817_t